MLGELEGKTGRVVVADLEQGVGTISRLGNAHVDRLLLVVEPYAKSLETARRALRIAREVAIEDVALVATRIRSPEDLEHIRKEVPGVPIHEVPDDPAVLEADRAGLAPIDHAPGSPAVAAIAGLADTLDGSG